MPIRIGRDAAHQRVVFSHVTETRPVVLNSIVAVVGAADGDGDQLTASYPEASPAGWAAGLVCFPTRRLPQRVWQLQASWRFIIRENAPSLRFISSSNRPCCATRPSSRT